jgi:hypothetical protein
MLSMLSFVSMRMIGADSAGFTLPAPSANVAQPPPGAAAHKAPEKKPPPPRLEGVPRPVANALADGRVVVLLFVEPGAAEDRATAKQFGALSRLGRRVHPVRASIADVGRYSGIVANLGITQAPAVVIVRPDLKAVPPIEGYAESGYLLQRVKDQLR